MKAGSQAEETAFNNVPRKSTWEKLLWFKSKLDFSRKNNQKTRPCRKFCNSLNYLFHLQINSVFHGQSQDQDKKDNTSGDQERNMTLFAFASILISTTTKKKKYHSKYFHPHPILTNLPSNPIICLIKFWVYQTVRPIFQEAAHFNHNYMLHIS